MDKRGHVAFDGGVSTDFPVVVLTDQEALVGPDGFARAGVAGVMHRAQGARQIMSFVAQVLAEHEVVQSVVLAFNVAGDLRMH